MYMYMYTMNILFNSQPGLAMSTTAIDEHTQKHMSSVYVECSCINRSSASKSDTHKTPHCKATLFPPWGCIVTNQWFCFCTQLFELNKALVREGLKEKYPSTSFYTESELIIVRNVLSLMLALFCARDLLTAALPASLSMKANGSVGRCALPTAGFTTYAPGRAGRSQNRAIPLTYCYIHIILIHI